MPGPPTGVQPQTAPTFKIAYYNIQSGMGTAALAGTCPFERNANCTDRSKPLNAWGTGAVQAELERAVKDDPSIIALGLGEAWNCAKADAVLEVLGWKAHAGERNGISLLARHGFAGPAEWHQLDTTLNKNPADTMWVVRAPVCADASCSKSIQVYTSHWYASGETRLQSFERQARGTVAFLDRLPASEPRVLVGDLNVWAEGDTVCNQAPVPGAVQVLRDAGYTDAWPAVHGIAELVEGRVRLGVGLLHQVLGIGRVARHAQRGRIHLVEEFERVPLEARGALGGRLGGRAHARAQALGLLRLAVVGPCVGTGNRTHLLKIPGRAESGRA
jgi:hypothetical protein